MKLNQQQRQFIIQQFGQDLSDDILIEWFKKEHGCNTEDFEETLAEARDVAARRAQLENYHND
jgi:hypothetical protein